MLSLLLIFLRLAVICAVFVENLKLLCCHERMNPKVMSVMDANSVIT
ncbi:hypothetical protein APHCRT_0811 [Anaplasma phagocytophilum str. CRT53-1]|uniref:Uncharacterized protein n=1 Tax=Anaplasma phagocytophilum str. CRT53-1 TaxID=1359157 RepID=A0A0F3Q3W1_ANAPH|nr:hypothetical protein APHCRT_0811 [Anaplasma phagocytophilum str. CRT53-1]